METVILSPEIQAEQRAYKTSKDAFKSRIKELSIDQSDLKNQRKTVRIVGERTISADGAASTHSMNRHELRHLHIAYSLFRKDFGGYTKKVPMPKKYNKDLVKQLIEIYGVKTVYFSKTRP